MPFLHLAFEQMGHMKLKRKTYLYLLPKTKISMRIHFIAIGGSAMHNLAIALTKAGNTVTGSDDEIFEPSRSRLHKYGLMPEQQGWFPEKIHKGLDAVILGMHARADNPELLKSKELGIKIYSYPEFLYEQSKAKNRVVVGGSHGKTTITSMILHVMRQYGIETDFMVGAQLEGFEIMVQLSDHARFIVMEGDEYPSSPIDLRPKFHLYKPHIAIISGIAWDHINVFPTWEIYLSQFSKFIDSIEPNGKLVYCADDLNLVRLVEQSGRKDIIYIPYLLPQFEVYGDKTSIFLEGEKYELNIFGRHNLLNLQGALEVCLQMGIDLQAFGNAIASFGGASRRLEKIYDSKGMLGFLDFAHAPSKLKATTQAVKEQFPNKKLIACMELHTYSSLSKNFLAHYEGTMEAADHAIVFYSPHALQMKKLPDLLMNDVLDAFKKQNLEVINDSAQLVSRLEALASNETCFLFMSSGNFGGLNIRDVTEKIGMALIH